MRKCPRCGAQSCPGETKRGLDNRLWVSCELGSGQYRWQRKPTKAKAKKTVAPAKIRRKKKVKFTNSAIQYKNKCVASGGQKPQWRGTEVHFDRYFKDMRKPSSRCPSRSPFLSYKDGQYCCRSQPDKAKHYKEVAKMVREHTEPHAPTLPHFLKAIKMHEAASKAAARIENRRRLKGAVHAVKVVQKLNKK